MAQSWINELFCPPYLISSPAAPFLLHYYPDGVGMSASTNMRTPVKRKPGGAKPGRDGDAEDVKQHDLSDDCITAPEGRGLGSFCLGFGFSGFGAFILERFVGF